MLNLKYPALLISLILVTLDASAQFECAGYRGSCKKSPKDQTGRGQFSCYELSSKMEKGKRAGEIYCPFFQCDEKDNVRMSKSTDKYKPPGVIGDGLINIGTISADGVRCYANCCYGTKGNFLGEVNVVKGCKNLCCNTMEAYLAGDCSRGNSNPPPRPPSPPSPPGEIDPDPGEIEEPPLFPGEIENNSKAKENPLFGNEFEF